jgi:hypothetical protein
MVEPDPAADAIFRPSRVWSRSEVVTRPSRVPGFPGVYGWWFRGLLEEVITSSCIDFQGLKLLYVGIAPRGPALSKATLRSRLRAHYTGNAEGSTLRLTLGCVLGLELRRSRSGRTMTFGPHETDLSQWMAENAFVTWVEHNQPWVLEASLIGRLDLPLNLEQNSHHIFHVRLAQLRRDARRAALALPSWDG